MGCLYLMLQLYGTCETREQVKGPIEWQIQEQP